MASQLSPPPVGLVALLLAVVFMGTSSTPTDDSAQVNLSEVREDVVREMYDSSGALINPDRQLQSVGKAHTGGYGGHYFDSSDPSTVYVYMTDVTQTAAAESAFRAAQRDDGQYTHVVPVQGRYSMSDLVDWFYKALKAFNADGIEVKSAGLRPADNGFAFTIGGNLAGAWSIVDRLEIPRGAVSLKVGEGWELLVDKENLRSEWRPGVGGIQIQRPGEWPELRGLPAILGIPTSF